MRFRTNKFLALFAVLLAVLITAGPAFAATYTLLSGATTTGAGTSVATGMAKGVGCLAYSAAGSSATVTFQQSFDNSIWWTAATSSNPSATGEAFVLPGMPYTRPNVTAYSSGTLSAKCSLLNAEVSQAALAVPTATATAAKVGVIKATWTNAELVAAASAAYNKTVGTLPANSVVKHTYVIVDGQATFAAGTLTASLGVVGTGYVDWLLAGSVKAAAATVYGDAAAERATENSGNLYYAAAQTIYAQFAAGAGTTATVTGSSGTIYVVYETLP